MDTYLLNGKGSEGLFDSEGVLLFDDWDGKEVGLIASKTYFPRADAVRVKIVDSDGDRYVVELPGDVYGGGRFVAVRRGQIELAGV